MKRIIQFIGMMLVCGVLQAQVSTETIQKELSFVKKNDANTLMIFNINGDVTVTGYDGDKILVEAVKKISGKTSERLEKGKQEIQLGIIDRADSILLYVNGLCSEFGKRPKKEDWHSKWNGWGYNWNLPTGQAGNCNRRDGHCETEYDYEINFTIKVPRSINVLASTVNDGDVVIENVNRSVRADNVNGSIRLTNISGATYASTINGDVDLIYTNNPPGDSRYYSLNGDINANFKKGLAADLSFESFNGDLYTNVDQLEPLPVSIEKEPTSKGMKYKIGGTRYRIGKGGIHIDFETFNGNVYVKEL